MQRHVMHVGIESKKKGLTQQTTRCLLQLTQAARRYESKESVFILITSAVSYLFSFRTACASVGSEQKQIGSKVITTFFL